MTKGGVSKRDQTQTNADKHWQTQTDPEAQTQTNASKRERTWTDANKRLHPLFIQTEVLRRVLRRGGGVVEGA